ncbi:MAG: cupin domain-containing protein [Solirubrobacterales bacterium]|nr:cupin domain-containing protein [Solirubrobacterales bacterium]MBV9367340.1 cupin domain-containing protein [Solirubrobacterales bacterium]MBV9683693.1 cupin domain-containing protein [Solirubrobacterales bacterium]MBV9807581.1 cupin domain-containing protein [Solirubrobacterales bacterium]
MSRFVKKGEVEDEQFDWGVIGWRCVPSTGAKQLVVMDVKLEPGEGHDFHRHPGQEEVIIVKRGRITQYLERDSTELGPEDSVFIEADVVHASFNEGDELADLQVIIAPSLGEGSGYGLVDVSGEEPWASLRSASGAAGA